MPALAGKIPYIIGAVIVVLLQLIVSPYITIGYANCNFILCYTIILALCLPSNPPYIIAFVLGFVYDLAGSGPVGGMALICVLISLIISKLYISFNNDTLFVPIALIVGAVLFAEVIYALLVIACGLDVSFLDALIYRILPCSAYDIVLTLVIFPIVVRIMANRAQREEMKVIN